MTRLISRECNLPRDARFNAESYLNRGVHARAFRALLPGWSGRGPVAGLSPLGKYRRGPLPCLARWRFRMSSPGPGGMQPAQGANVAG